MKHLSQPTPFMILGCPLCLLREVVRDHAKTTARSPNHRRLHEQDHHLVGLYRLVLDRDQERPADRLRTMATGAMVSKAAWTEVGVP